MDNDDFIMVIKMFGMFALAGALFCLVFTFVNVAAFSYDKWRCVSVGGSFEPQCNNTTYKPCNNYGCRTK